MKVIRLFVDPAKNPKHPLIVGLRAAPEQVDCGDKVRPLLLITPLEFYRIMSDSDLKNLVKCYAEREDGSVTEAVLYVADNSPGDGASDTIPTKSGGISLDALTIGAFHLEVKKTSPKARKSVMDFPPKRVPRKLIAKSRN